MYIVFASLSSILQFCLYSYTFHVWLSVCVAVCVCLCMVSKYFVFLYILSCAFSCIYVVFTHFIFHIDTTVYIDDLFLDTIYTYPLALVHFAYFIPFISFEYVAKQNNTHTHTHKVQTLDFLKICEIA